MSIVSFARCILFPQQFLHRDYRLRTMYVSIIIAFVYRAKLQLIALLSSVKLPVVYHQIAAQDRCSQQATDGARSRLRLASGTNVNIARSSCVTHQQIARFFALIYMLDWYVYMRISLVIFPSQN